MASSRLKLSLCPTYGKGEKVVGSGRPEGTSSMLLFHAPAVRYPIILLQLEPPEGWPIKNVEAKS